MNGRSLAGSLSQGLSLGLLVMMLLQWLLVTQVLQQLTLAYVGSRLGHDAESLLAAIETGHGSLLLSPERLNPTFSRPFSGHYYQLSAQGLELSSRSLWTHHLPLPASDQGPRLLQSLGPLRQRLLILQQTADKDGSEIQLAVAEDISPSYQALERFSLNYALISGLLLLLLLLLQRWLIGRLLRPLRQTQADIARLEQEAISRLDEAVPAEIQPLVRAFNGLLAQQQLRLNRARDSLGDLSHALKRPLTRIRQLLEDQPWPELAAEVSQIGEQIDRQLARARLAGRAPLMPALPLEALLQELLPALRQLHADKTLSFSLELAPNSKLRMDRQDALELLGNLLDNACKWAHGHILISASELPGSGLDLQISDDGPGVSPNLLAQLSQRGVRADQQVPGHGLGLAIARDLAQAYDGELELGSSPLLGGFQVSLRLPGQPES